MSVQNPDPESWGGSIEPMPDPYEPQTRMEAMSAEEASDYGSGGIPHHLDEPEESAVWAARLSDPEFYKDHRAALVGIGAAALALGAGVYKLSKRHGEKDIKIGFADRHFEKSGIISIVEKTAKGGSALGAAVSEAALKAAEQTKDVFAMDDDGDKLKTAYALLRSEDIPIHRKVIKRAGGWLADIYNARSKQKDPDL